jgi:hypothetical protein
MNADQRAAELVRVVNPDAGGCVRVRVLAHEVTHLTREKAEAVATLLRADLAAALRAYGEQCRAEGARDATARAVAACEETRRAYSREADRAADTDRTLMMLAVSAACAADCCAAKIRGEGGR